MAFEGLIHDVKLDPHTHPITVLMHCIKYMMDWVRPVGQPALDGMKGFGFWISVHFRYTQPAKELTDMRLPIRRHGQEAAHES